MDEHEHSYGEYQRRKRAGLLDCPGCRTAATTYHRERRRANPEVRRREQAKVAAYDRALRRLAKRHPVEFRTFLTEEQAKIQ
jgi:hypothetical protein